MVGMVRWAGCIGGLVVAAVGVSPAQTRPAALSAGVPLPAARVLELSMLDAVERAAEPRNGVLAVGVNRRVPAGHRNEGSWDRLPSGRMVWRLAVRSPEARAVRLRFEDFDVRGGRVWLYAPEAGASGEAAGPYTGRGIFGDGEFWTATLAGENVVVEYEPEEGSGDLAVPFRIGEVAHIWTADADPSAEAASCQIDASCYPEWSTLMSGVGRLVYASGGKTYSCTATLIGGSDESVPRYVLTARHCVGDDTTARTVEIRWLYRTGSCNGALAATALYTLGARYVTGTESSQTDTSLLSPLSMPAGVWALGWQTAEPAVGASLVVIHHPRAEYQRIAIGNRLPDRSAGTRPAASYYYVEYSQGLTEPGSSGAALLTGDGLVSGVLSVGPAALETSAQYCAYKPYWNLFGRSSVSHATFQTYLAAAASAKAAMISPVNRSIVKPITTFTWSAGRGATRYRLSIGTQAGGTDLYDQEVGMQLSATVRDLPANGRAVYTRLWTLVSGDWQYADYAYLTVRGTAVENKAAEITSPANGSTFTSPAVTFEWTDTGADQYYLKIGSAAGAQDLYGADQGVRRGVVVTGLPTDGRTLYVRLQSRFGVQWFERDYVYRAWTAVTPKAARITEPADGGTLAAGIVRFVWLDVAADQYTLAVGSQPGNREYYYAEVGTSTAAFVRVPANGQKVHARLYARFGTQTLTSDSTYLAAPRPAHDGAAMSQPKDGATLASLPVTFQWNDAGADQYFLAIGSLPGLSEYYNADQGQSLSAAVARLPWNAGVLFVRLYSRFGADWVYNDYSYKVAYPPPAAASITSPANGATLSPAGVTFEWNDAGADQYYLAIGSRAGGNDLLNQDQGTRRSATVTGLPADGRIIYVRLLSRFDGVWFYSDSSYRSSGGE